ncbi:MAG: DNA-3-methyladenine glycosylase [Promethearchaeota archaeon]|nr:MAG: DNA-3-methyladenine glycosylase [Candidatus Lokiarchaeota archaeon]
MAKIKCDWAKENELLEKYHDSEWGTPVHDDQILFEFLILQIFQAGLNWSLILKKRENFRTAFDNFNYKKIAKYSEKKVEELMENKGIIRNELKIRSSITDAKIFMEIQDEFGSFDTYIWDFVSGFPIHNGWEEVSQIPSTTDLSDKISKDLKERGMKFIGSTIIYSYLQSVGIINDHLKNCFRYKELTD